MYEKLITELKELELDDMIKVLSRAYAEKYLDDTTAQTTTSIFQAIDVAIYSWNEKRFEEKKKKDKEKFQEQIKNL